MNFFKWQGLVITLLLTLVVSCGSDSDKNKNGSGASAQALEYYGQFINSVDGTATNVELVGSNINNNSNIGSGQMGLKLDVNYTYQVYIKDFSGVSSVQNVVKSGTWRIEGDILILDGFAKTFSSLNNLNNGFVNAGVNGCLQMQITTALNTAGLGGSFIASNAGSQVSFCKQASTL